MLLIRIPQRISGKHDPICTLLRRQSSQIPNFAMKTQEIRFCFSFIERLSNWWLFRCHQRQFLGDFIAIDMSAPNLSQRKIWVLELKMHQDVHSKKGFQLRNATRAIERLLQLGIVNTESPVAFLHGDGPQVLDFLSGVVDQKKQES